jgi:hypothetical protein
MEEWKMICSAASDTRALAADMCGYHGVELETIGVRK